MKQIIKKFNNLVNRTIFNVQNKTNNNFHISSFNKYLITFIASLFIYLFYLLTPLLYNKEWVQTNIESKILNTFKLDISTSADISYRILPSPHFLIKDSKILLNDGKKKKTVAEVKNFRAFLSQRNFFNKKKMNIKKLIIDDANFSLLNHDFKLLNELKGKKFSNKKIEINKSNIFLNNNLREIISIIKVDKATLFFDNEKLSNFLNFKGSIFNTPFTFNFSINHDTNKFEKINFKSKPLKLNISNISTKENKIISGKNNILLSRSKINTKYNIKENLIIFKSDNSRIDNSQLKYTGELSTKPFDLFLKIYLDDYKISKLFNINPILIEFIKSGLLFNENISVDMSANINSSEKNEIFQNVKINFNIANGKLNFDNTMFINNKIGLLKLNNSNLFSQNNNLILNTDILFEIKNSNHLFSFLNTNKRLRKKIKNVLVNLDYNFSSNEIKFNDVKINNKDVSDKILNIFNEFNDNHTNNKVKSRRLINKLLGIYEG
jgi:hypothetical protein